MALCANLQKSQRIISPYFLTAVRNKLLKSLTRNHGDKAVTLDPDTLDDFTSQLMQRKSNKWEVMRTRRQLSSEQDQFKCGSKPKQGKINVEYLDVNELNTLLGDAVESENKLLVGEIIDECGEVEALLTLTVLLKTLSFYARLGDKEAIENIVRLCSKVHSEILKDNSYFKHYLAEATWVKGDIIQAISLFEDVYRCNAYLRRRIRLMLKYLLFDAVANRSEAALLNMIGFAERLVDDFRDYYPLACIWQACFLSEWFTDQCIALDLLMSKDGLCKALSTQMPYVIALALKNHQTDIVYRLLEVLLKLEQVSQYTRIVEAIFDYRVHQGDLRGCSEIIQWSLKQNIVLPAIQEEKFVDLLLAYTSNPLSFVEVRKQKLPRAPSLHFKF